MARLLIGITFFVIVFLLKVIMGAAAGALKGVEHSINNNDFEKFTGERWETNRQTNLIDNTSGADLIRGYRQLYEENIISYDEYEMKREAILRNDTI